MADNLFEPFLSIGSAAVEFELSRDGKQSVISDPLEAWGKLSDEERIKVMCVLDIERHTPVEYPFVSIHDADKPEPKKRRSGGAGTGRRKKSRLATARFALTFRPPSAEEEAAIDEKREEFVNSLFEAKKDCLRSTPPAHVESVATVLDKAIAIIRSGLQRWDRDADFDWRNGVPGTGAPVNHRDAYAIKAQDALTRVWEMGISVDGQKKITPPEKTEPTRGRGRPRGKTKARDERIIQIANDTGEWYPLKLLRLCEADSVLIAMKQRLSLSIIKRATAKKKKQRKKS